MFQFIHYLKEVVFLKLLYKLLRKGKMGTRSLTIINNSPKLVEKEEICVMYRQYDGYPKGHGKELIDFLKGIEIVNGIPLEKSKRMANGMGCLTVQVIAHFKEGVGGIYLERAGTRNMNEKYIYTIYPNRTGNKIKLKIERSDEKTLYNGLVDLCEINDI